MVEAWIIANPRRAKIAEAWHQAASQPKPEVGVDTSRLQGRFWQQVQLGTSLPAHSLSAAESSEQLASPDQAGNFHTRDVATISLSSAARTLPEAGQGSCIQEPAFVSFSRHDQTRTNSQNDNAVRGLRSRGIRGFFGKNQPFLGVQRPEFAKNSINRGAGRSSGSWGGYTLRGGLIIGAALAVVWCAYRGLLRDSRPPRTPIQADRRYATGTGQHRTVTLRDGTRIQLAPNTTLTLSREFGQQTRTVALMGEAYFQTTATKRTPFIVRTGTASTRVIGTAFVVRHYPSDQVVRVGVVTGKVVTAGFRGVAVAVTANRLARVSDSSVTVTDTDVHSLTAWTQGELVFKDAPVLDMLATVGRWYGYHFRLTDSVLATRNVSVIFKTADSADMMLKLKALLGVTMHFDGSTITLVAKPQDIEIPVRSRHFSSLREMGK